ncbi:MAG: Crp/Fnr family transcriptional regulator [Leptospirillia bacterium]
MSTHSPSIAKIWFLKRIHLFDELNAADMEMLDQRTRMDKIPRRGVVFEAGQPGDAVYLLKSGRVKLTRTQDGKELLLAILEPGEVFGEMAALTDSPHDTRAEAMEDAAICVIQKADFEDMLSRQPRLSLRLTKLVGLRLRHIETRLHDLVYQDVNHRLASLLLDLIAELGEPSPSGPEGAIRIKAKLTHQEMAGLIASTRETVSLTLGHFRDQGLITMERRSLTVTDPSGLRAILG